MDPGGGREDRRPGVGGDVQTAVRVARLTVEHPALAITAGLDAFHRKQEVDIDDLSEDGLEGGWLLESNRMDPLPEDGSNIPPYNFHTAGPNHSLPPVA